MCLGRSAGNAGFGVWRRGLFTVYRIDETLRHGPGENDS